MQIMSIVAAAAIAFFASVGTTAAQDRNIKVKEVHVDRFMAMEGIEARALDTHELAAVAAAAWFAINRRDISSNREIRTPRGETAVNGIRCYGGGRPMNFPNTLNPVVCSP